MRGLCGIDCMVVRCVFEMWNEGSLWSWSYGSWVYICVCNLCLSPIKLWVRFSLMSMCTWYNFICYSPVCQSTWQTYLLIMYSVRSWFSPCKTDCGEIIEISLKVVSNISLISFYIFCFKVEINLKKTKITGNLYVFTNIASTTYNWL
jgi:hypothetical protein